MEWASFDQLRFQQAFNGHNSSSHHFGNNTEEHAIYPCQLLTQGCALLPYVFCNDLRILVLPLKYSPHVASNVERAKRYSCPSPSTLKAEVGRGGGSAPPPLMNTCTYIHVVAHETTLHPLSDITAGCTAKICAKIEEENSHRSDDLNNVYLHPRSILCVF